MNHKLKPFQLSDPDRYSRLFPPDESPVSAADERLANLAASMCNKIACSPSLGHRNPKIPAGYTYFGQFIDHDMTSEDHNPAGIIREPRDIRNARFNCLNLDSLYGAGPGGNKPLYQANGASFRIRAPGNRSHVLDVPLDSSNKPVVAEPRNLENVIVRQLHAMFLKLHNLAVEVLPRSLPPTYRFWEARRRVCHQYQWLVRNDFLARICESVTYGDIITETMFDWNGRFSIPVEFSRAAFRFGHSMVREKYQLTGKQSIPLLCLFGNEDFPEIIPADQAVPWSRFLGPIAKEFAMEINTSIVPTLFEIPRPSAQLFKSIRGDEMKIVLPHITLQRGSEACLPSGQTVRQALRVRPVAAGAPGCDPWLDAQANNLASQTPLWYYILLEAEMNGSGRCLGPVGSRIVGEVIEGALWANKNSYLRVHGRLWKPGPWVNKDLKIERQIETLHDLAIVVGAT